MREWLRVHQNGLTGYAALDVHKLERFQAMSSRYYCYVISMTFGSDVKTERMKPIRNEFIKQESAQTNTVFCAPCSKCSLANASPIPFVDPVITTLYPPGAFSSACPSALVRCCIRRRLLLLQGRCDEWLSAGRERCIPCSHVVSITLDEQSLQQSVTTTSADFHYLH